MPVEKPVSRVENFFSFIDNPCWWHECTLTLVRIAVSFLGSHLPGILGGPDAVWLCVLWRHQNWALASIQLGHNSFSLFILSIPSSNTWMKESTRKQRNKGRNPRINIWMSRCLKTRYCGSPFYCLFLFSLIVTRFHLKLQEKYNRNLRLQTCTNVMPFGFLTQVWA